MYQIAFGGWAPPGPAGRAYSAPQDPLAGLREPTSKGRGVEGGKRGGRGGWIGRGREEGEEREEEGEGRLGLGEVEVPFYGS